MLNVYRTINLNMQYERTVEIQTVKYNHTKVGAWLGHRACTETPESKTNLTPFILQLALCNLPSVSRSLEDGLSELSCGPVVRRKEIPHQHSVSDSFLRSSFPGFCKKHNISLGTGFNYSAFSFYNQKARFPTALVPNPLTQLFL